MPFYLYESENGEKKEFFFEMSEMQDEIIRNDKKWKRIPQFGTNFRLKGRGWASKGTATANKPEKMKEVGIEVDEHKKNQMMENGEI